MGKILDFAAAAFLVLLLWTVLYAPHNPLLWVASATVTFTVLRGILALLLVWFLVYTPETKVIRVPVGVFAMLFSLWLAVASFEGTIQFIDSLSLYMAMVALMLSLLETKPKEEPFRSVQLISHGVRRTAHEIQFVSRRAFQLGWLLLTDLDMALEEYYQRLGSNKPAPNHGYQRHFLRG